MKEPINQLTEEDAVNSESIVGRHSSDTKNDLYVDPLRLKETILQYMVIRGGAGDRAQYRLMAMWCFERTDGVQAYSDAVTGEHIEGLNPSYYK